MDYTEIAISIMTAVITCAVPVLVAFAVAYGRKAVAALETSKYAEAYQSLDPIVRDAVEAAAGNAVRMAKDSAIRFGGRADVRSFVLDAATKAAAGLGEAAGVRVDLQRSHVIDLAEIATDAALAELDELDVEPPITLEDDPPAEWGDAPVYGPGFYMQRGDDERVYITPPGMIDSMQTDEAYDDSGDISMSLGPLVDDVEPPRGYTPSDAPLYNPGGILDDDERPGGSA